MSRLPGSRRITAPAIRWIAPQQWHSWRMSVLTVQSFPQRLAAGARIEWSRLLGRQLANRGVGVLDEGLAVFRDLRHLPPVGPHERPQVGQLRERQRG